MYIQDYIPKVAVSFLQHLMDQMIKSRIFSKVTLAAMSSSAWDKRNIVIFVYIRAPYNNTHT